MFHNRTILLRLGMLLAVVIVIVLPFYFAHAASWLPLVPCGRSDQSAMCQFCDFFKLIDNVKNFLLVDVLTPLAVLFIVIGGLAILTGGAKPGNIVYGRKVIWDTVLSVFIIFSAWMITNTILQLFTGDNNISTHWYSISCNVESGITIGGPTPVPIVTTGTGTRTGTTITGSTKVDGTCYKYCPNGTKDDSDGDGWGFANNASCVVKGGSQDTKTSCATPTSTRTGSTRGQKGGCHVTDSGYCAKSRLAQICGDWNPSKASVICNYESAGGQADIPSQADVCRLKPSGRVISYSRGLFQINIFQSALPTFPECENVLKRGKCLGRFVPNGLGQPVCKPLRECSFTRSPEAFNKCAQALSVPDRNTIQACYLYNHGGFSTHWGTTVAACRRVLNGL